MKYCPTCHQPLIHEQDRKIPASEFHVYCKRCQWPIAKKLMDESGVCSLCKDATNRYTPRNKKEET